MYKKNWYNIDCVIEINNICQFFVNYNQVTQLWTNKHISIKIKYTWSKKFRGEEKVPG